MAEPFAPLSAVPAPLRIDNLDTDTIIPSREMRSTGRTGLAAGLFAPLRYTDVDRRIEDARFVLNRPEHRGATILLGGTNFGCGSSREHAVWALAEYGVRAIIAESFAPIFAANCVRNCIAPAAVSRAAIDAIASDGGAVTVDLQAGQLVLGDMSWPFALAPEDQAMLLGGLDAIDLTLRDAGAISEWTARDRVARPWVYEVRA